MDTRQFVLGGCSCQRRLRGWAAVLSRLATCHFCQLSMLAVSKRIGGTGGSASMFEQPMFERSVSRGKPALAAPARGCGLGTLVGADSF